ncbi:MAG: paraquat-inducible protein A [Phycisphaerae bacterium]|nr:paraquat-inducible protein A [Phycisphaerae bacterium]
MRTVCHACGLEQHVRPLGPSERARCARCSRPLLTHASGDASRAAAVALAALILLIPANVLPILELEYLGRVSASTVWGGCVALWNERMWLVATIVFLASIAIPFAKLAAIFYLSIYAGTRRMVAFRARLLVALEVVGRWSMLDVFLLAVLVAVIKLDSLSSARPGPGLFFFAAVVVLTMVSSALFDSRALWRELIDVKSPNVRRATEATT